MSTEPSNDPLKTPTKPQNPELIVHSTPHSQGTAASAEYWRSELIRDVEIPILEDLRSSTACSFEDMLIALIAMTQRPGHLDENGASQAKEAATETLKQYLQKAAAYVNSCLDGNANTSARELRDAVKEYCAETHETPCYGPLAKALNNILAAFPPEGQTPADDRIIFHVNDPAVIGSKRLEEAHSTKRKPDIVAVTCKVAQTLSKSHLCGVRFDDIAYALSEFRKDRKSRPRKDRDHSEQLKWLDILQAWELKSTHKTIPYNENEKFSGSRFPFGEGGVPAEDIPIPEKSVPYMVTISGIAELTVEQDTGEKKGKGKGKRLAEDDPTSSATKKHKSIADNDSRLPPIVQCALYATERLMCHPHIGHTIDVILQDDVLHLWWYDKQGAIQSSGIRITQHLSHFVAMIMIFQRFDKRMWGHTNLDSGNLSFDSVAGVYKIDEGTQNIGYQLIGRSTYTADVLLNDVPAGGLRRTRKQTQDAADDASRRFIKISWPEAARVPEPDFITEARRKAGNQTREIKEMILPHLPSLCGSRDFADYATDTVRHLLGLAAQGSRILRICLFEKLRPVTELEPDVFWKAYWEILRCHALLWKLGIAHGDISVSNMMFAQTANGPRGVLNDFDLAAHVDEQTNTAPELGYRRTGTLPYMALQLLTDGGWKGLARRYRHDLESLFWCLAWVCGCVQGRQENHSTPQFVDWMSGNHNQIRRLKMDYVYGLNQYHATTDFASHRPLLRKMSKYWGDLQNKITSAFEDETLREQPDVEHLQKMLGFAQSSSTLPVPIDFPIDFLSETLKKS